MIFSEGDQNMYLCVFLFIMFPLYSNNCISSRYLSSKYVIISNTANFRLKYVHYRFNCHYPEVIIICCKQRGVVMGKKFWKKGNFFFSMCGPFTFNVSLQRMKKNCNRLHRYHTFEFWFDDVKKAGKFKWLEKWLVVI